MRSDLTPWTIRGAGIAAGIALVVGLIALAVAAGGVLILLFVAILLASALEPIVGLIRDRLPLGRGATILVVYATFFVTVLGLAFIVVPAAIAQGEQVVAGLPAFFESARSWADGLRPHVLSTSVTALIDSVASVTHQAPPDLEPGGRGRRGGGRSGGDPRHAPDDRVLLAGRARPAPALPAVVRARRRARRRARCVERDRDAAGPVGARPADADGARWASRPGIAYSVLGVPGALLLGLIAAITEAIPIVGPLLGAIPAVLVATTVSPELAVIVAGVYIVLQLIEGSVLVPLVMRNTVGISPLLVLLSVLVGAAVGGFIGALLAVPIAASAEIVLARLQARDTPVAQDPSAVETPDEDEREGYEHSLPDAGEGVPAS